MSPMMKGWRSSIYIAFRYNYYTVVVEYIGIETTSLDVAASFCQQCVVMIGSCLNIAEDISLLSIHLLTSGGISGRTGGTCVTPASTFPFCFTLRFNKAPITVSALQSRSLDLQIAIALMKPSLGVINRCSMKKLFSSQ